MSSLRRPLFFPPASARLAALAGCALSAKNASPVARVFGTERKKRKRNAARNQWFLDQLRASRSHAFHQPKIHRLRLVFLGCHGSLHGAVLLNILVPATRVVKKAFWCKSGIVPASLFAAAPLRNLEAVPPTFCKGKRTSEGDAQDYATFKGSLPTLIFARLTLTQVKRFSAGRKF